MEPEAALEAMKTAMASGNPQVAVMAVDFDRFVAHQDAGTTKSYYQQVVNKQGPDKKRLDNTQQRSPSPQAKSGSILQILNDNPKQRAGLLQNYIGTTVASVLGITVEVDPRRGFFELGMDSLTSLELRNRLQRELGCRLDATLTFKHPSVSALSAYLLALLSDAADPEQASVAQHEEAVFKDMSEQDLSALLDEQLAEIDRLLAQEDL